MCCILSTSIQILKAIHNLRFSERGLLRAVYYLLRYKFWKLFTTDKIRHYPNHSCILSTSIQILKAIHNDPCKAYPVIALYIIYFDTNFESYSQLYVDICNVVTCCILSTSIQILKAIHNLTGPLTTNRYAVYYLLRYKFWKLFTTSLILNVLSSSLYIIYFDTNFESYSQLVLQARYWAFSCILSTSIQILKAIHNLIGLFFKFDAAVYYLLRYKFWKLFTTVTDHTFARVRLYIIYFDTNFESYSQPQLLKPTDVSCCILSTSIQILKAIHNVCIQLAGIASAVYYLLRYKFWKLFTTMPLWAAGMTELYIIYFDTNFESYSQPLLSLLR